VSDVPAPGAARSLWLQEALAADPGEPCPPLDAHVGADVAIVGGGFAGLWTAVHLTERDPGLRIALLEADIVGGGASGRNGGFASSSWFDLPALVDLFGETEGLRYAQVQADQVGWIGTFAAEHGIDARYHLEGAVSVAAGGWQEARATRPELYERLGVADRLRNLDGDGVRAFADVPSATGGTFTPDCAVCQPAMLARGLRRVLLERGVRIYERTPATDIERSRPAVVRAPHGAVRADRVVFTLGAWAAGWRGYGRSFGVISDYVAATEPIADRLAEIGWTSQVGMSDGRDWLYYLRPTDDGRIVIGGGEGGAVYGGRAGGRAATHAHRYARAAARGLTWLFPRLEGVRWTHAWGGPIDQTPSFLPFYRSDGPVHAGLGFSGHGLVQTQIGGRILASTVLGVEDDWTSLPVNRPEISMAPPEPFRYPAVAAAAWALGRGDERQERGRSRGALYRLVGDGPMRYRERVTGRGAQ
jgi:glycine/D-amino acid oxidase-like deaminating enzyme